MSSAANCNDGTFLGTWIEYHQKVLPTPCGPIQLKETHQAFYSGGMAMLALITRAESINDDTEAEEYFRKLGEEMVAFATDVEVAAKIQDLIRKASSPGLL